MYEEQKKSKLLTLMMGREQRERKLADFEDRLSNEYRKWYLKEE